MWVKDVAKQMMYKKIKTTPANTVPQWITPVNAENPLILKISNITNKKHSISPPSLSLSVCVYRERIIYYYYHYYYLHNSILGMPCRLQYLQIKALDNLNCPQITQQERSWGVLSGEVKIGRDCVGLFIHLLLFDV